MSVWLASKAVGTRLFHDHPRDCVYAVCAAHLAVCVAMVATMIGGSEPLQLGSVLIPQWVQWANGAFTALSIVTIICAGVGTMYLIESHLNAYFYLLAVSALVDATWVVELLVYGTACYTETPDAEIQKGSVRCTFTVVGYVLIFCSLFVFKLFGMAAVESGRRCIRIRYGEEMLPHLRKSLQQSFGGHSPSHRGDWPAGSAPCTGGPGPSDPFATGQTGFNPAGGSLCAPAAAPGGGSYGTVTRAQLPQSAPVRGSTWQSAREMHQHDSI